MTLNQSAHRQVVLYLTHFIDEHVLAEFARLRAEAGTLADVVLLFNTGDRDDVPDAVRALPHHITVESELSLYPFPNKYSMSFYPNNIDLPPIDFRMTHDGYDHYWVVEHDVRYTGDWKALIQDFAASPADLLCTNLFGYHVNETWHERYPAHPPEGESVDDEERLRGFFPIYRMSARAFDVLIEAYRKGWWGLYEAVVPLVLARAGCVLEDIGGAGAFVAPRNRNKYYLSTHRTLSMAPGTFTYRPVLLAPGNRANTLWHPVKPNHAYRRDSMRSNMLRRVYSVLLPLRILANRQPPRDRH
jgi:hypothetical protein